MKRIGQNPRLNLRRDVSVHLPLTAVSIALLEQYERRQRLKFAGGVILMIAIAQLIIWIV